MQERGVEVDASTIFRWEQRYAPELEKRIRWYQGYRLSSWRVDAAVVFYMKGNAINQHVGAPFFRHTEFEAVLHGTALEASRPREYWRPA